MKHAVELIGRVFLLEGIPLLISPAPVGVRSDVSALLGSDFASGGGAAQGYNDAIVLTRMVTP